MMNKINKYPVVQHNRAFRDIQNRRDFWNGTLKVYKSDNHTSKDKLLVLDMGLKNRGEGKEKIRPMYFIQALQRLLKMHGIEAVPVKGQPWIHIRNAPKYFSFQLEEVLLGSTDKGSPWFLYIETQYL